MPSYSDIKLTSEEKVADQSTNFLYQKDVYVESSSEDPPMEEWSSLSDITRVSRRSFTLKQRLFSQGLYSPGSGEVCAKYIAQSDSAVFRHPYFSYPAVVDPGIKSAFLDPEPIPPPFPDDGIDLYMHICEETNTSPIRLVYSNLKSKKINLAYYCVDSAGMRAIAKALEKNPYVQILNLTDNFLDFDACYHIGQMIKINAALTELILDGCKIGEKGLLRIGAGFCFNASIKKISLARNDLLDEGGALFANLMLEGANFRHIKLTHNKLGMKFSTALTNALCEKNMLNTLDLSQNPFVHISSTVELFNMIQMTNDALEELDLSFTGLDSERVAEAVSNLTMIPTLKTLNLRSNRFSDLHAPILILNLHEGKLETLDLSDNVFTPAGACIILSKMLRRKVKLQNLYLDNICVNRNFLAILDKVRKMKVRKNFVVTYDKVLHDWVAVGEDPRRLLLRRGAYMGKVKRKDMIEFLLSLSYAAENLRAKELVVMAKDKRIPVNDDWVAGLIENFPGPAIDRVPTISSALLREFIRRLWPDKQLPDDWTPPIMIRVDVKRKKKAVVSNIVLPVKGKKKPGKGAKVAKDAKGKKK